MAGTLCSLSGACFPVMLHQVKISIVTASEMIVTHLSFFFWTVPASLSPCTFFAFCLLAVSSAFDGLCLQIREGQGGDGTDDGTGNPLLPVNPFFALFTLQNHGQHTTLRYPTANSNSLPSALADIEINNIS